VTLKIDIRNKKLRGGRLTLDAKTVKKGERKARAAVVRALIKAEEVALIEGLRSRLLDIAEIERAWDLKDGARSRALNTLRARVTGGDYRGPTLGEQIERQLAKVAAKRRPRTHALYTIVAESIREGWPDDTLLADVLTTDVEQFLMAPKRSNGGRPWGASRQRSSLAFGSKVWKDAIRDEEERAIRENRSPLLTLNVWRRAESAARATPRVEYLRPEEWKVLRDKVAGLPTAAVLALGCRAGLRAHEAIYLRTGIDVDLDRQVIHIRARGGAWPWEPKTATGLRVVPMPDDLREILAEHARSYAGRTFFLATADDREKPIGYTTLKRWTRDSFRAAGIGYGRKKDALTFHSLRHTYASWLTQKGMHPKKVGRLIGDTPEMVLRIYGHLAEDDFSEAVGLLNDVVR